MPSSAYIHIPFCTHKCDFCDFAAFAGVDHLEDEYCRIVCQEIEKRCASFEPGGALNSVYFGGGTPGLIAADNLHLILRKLLSYFALAQGAEVCLETTPHSITRAKAAAWKELGINRLSIGVESLNDSELQAIGRDHTREQAIAGIELANESGCANISIDFMYALPTQTEHTWQETLDDFVRLAGRFDAIKHVSAYSLHLAGNSPLLFRFPKESTAYPPEESYEAMYDRLVDTLARAGFEQYEVSNFSKPGFASKHNLSYWNNSEYLAFGVGAHRYVKGVRSANLRSLSRYMKDFMKDEMREEIDQNMRMTEAIMLGLRLREGLDLQSFQHEFGLDLLAHRRREIEKLSKGGFLELKQNRLKLTHRGVPVSNSVIAELI
jgi:oxygen-independent coproporphyrinogen-3 oxidase